MSLLLLSYKCGPLLLIVTLVSTSKHLSQIGTSRVQISIVSQRPFSPFLLLLYCYCSVGILASSMRQSYWHRQNHDSATPEFVPAHRKLTHCCHAKQLWNLNLEEHAQKHREPPFVIMRLLTHSYELLPWREWFLDRLDAYLHGPGTPMVYRCMSHGALQQLFQLRAYQKIQKTRLDVAWQFPPSQFATLSTVQKLQVSSTL